MNNPRPLTVPEAKLVMDFLVINRGLLDDPMIHKLFSYCYSIRIAAKEFHQ